MNLPNKITLARIFLIPFFIVVLMTRGFGGVPTLYSDIAAAVIFADKLLIASALICLVELQRIPAYMAIIIIAREFIVTGLRIVAISNGVVMAAEMTGKIKTVIQIFATVITLLFPNVMIGKITLGYLVMLIATLFTIYSGYVYLSKNWDMVINSK